MLSRRAVASTIMGTLLLGSGEASAKPQQGSAFDFSLTAIDGTPLPLEQFRGKALLIVNTASSCGFTRQYEGLQKIWEAYRDSGLIVIGVPSNDFGGQEPKTGEEIESFCRSAYDITFPLAEKISVRGADAHPFYTWAAAQLGEAGKPRWNFHKYLAAPDGRLVSWFSPLVVPQSRRLQHAIDTVLPGPAR